MTLKQAYENWAGDNENKILATKSLSATKKCFLEKYGNTPLKEAYAHVQHIESRLMEEFGEGTHIGVRIEPAT